MGNSSSSKGFFGTDQRSVNTGSFVGTDDEGFQNDMSDLEVDKINLGLEEAQTVPQNI
jgi:hypothetical protein